ncbi:hypothetical protein PPYR_03655 [Photinus pyralis]|uniref:ABC transporter domain-containing protein n=2 Tax=Photinus pyralis TaxID=7054 RepID=A0A5N4A3F2_PHOPY|nr:ABC transporter G family member 20-like isoform X2 [Photinus pyralis]KAB0791855.1 hypothetical protein PPYR_03655 [Photinus pyralis]
MEEPAILVRGACKHYGVKDRTNVLESLDLTVPRGCIYALLGASGSGKTTLLNCMVGTKCLNSGTIRLLGTIPGESGAASPGPRVGYMPQENALYQELTIWETMKYFGWIAGMSTDEIKSRLRFLAELLLITDLDQQIWTLSGGEQRRISFAAALLYGPEIIILDEPTVGLDPILRESVWRYLIDLVDREQCTIVLTTHYIEETRQAHKVGLMRKGYVIAESSPRALLQRFQVDTLEEVFLKLSTLQDITEKDGSTRFVCRIQDDFTCSTAKKYNHPVRTSSPKHKIKALVWKQFVTLLRNVPLLLFTVMSAALSVSLFFIGVGHDPTGITVAQVNYETNRSYCAPIHCDSTSLSCNYLEILSSRFSNLRHLSSEGEAYALLRSGQIQAFFVVKDDFSPNMRRRIFDSRNLLTPAGVDVYRDYTAKDIAMYTKKVTVDAFDEFTSLFLDSCNVNRKLMKAPINVETPVYGEASVETTYMGGPAYLLMVSFCVASIVTSCSVLIERNEGTYDRVFAMGVRHVEILISHIITDSCLIVGQIVSSLSVAFLIFGLPLKGSIFLIFALAVANSFSGMCFGYAISSILKNESAVMHLLSGSMTPAVLLSGTMWPREGMHPFLQEAAWYLPITQAAHSILSILHRGWGLSRPTVYLGFANCFSWAAIFLVICLVFLRYEKT